MKQKLPLIGFLLLLCACLKQQAGPEIVEISGALTCPGTRSVLNQALSHEVKNWIVIPYDAEDGHIAAIRDKGTGETIAYPQYGEGASCHFRLYKQHRYNLYLVANVADPESLLDDIPETEAEMANWRLDFTRLSFRGQAGLGAIEHFGAIPAATCRKGFSPGGNGFSAVLEPLTAQVRLQLDEQARGSGGIRHFAVRQARLVQMAEDITVFSPASRAQKVSESYFDLLEPDEVRDLANGGSLDFCCLENCAGQVEGILSPADKTPEGLAASGRPDITAHATYLEVRAEVGGAYEGEVTYRIFLGSNTTDDFNLRRNKAYHITLGISADGISGAARESWWKVEFSGQTVPMSYHWQSPFQTEDGMFSDLDRQNSIILQNFFCNAATSLRTSVYPYEYDAAGESYGAPIPCECGTGNWRKSIQERNGRKLFDLEMQTTENSACIDIHFSDDYSSPKTHCILHIDNLETGMGLDVKIGIQGRNIPFLDLPAESPYTAQAVPLSGRGLAGTYDWEVSGPGRLASPDGAQNTLYCTGAGTVRIRLYNGTDHRFFQERELSVRQPVCKLTARDATMRSDGTLPLSLDGTAVILAPVYFDREQREIPRTAFDPELYAALLSLAAETDDPAFGPCIRMEAEDDGIRFEVIHLFGPDGQALVGTGQEKSGYLSVHPRCLDEGDRVRFLVADPFGWTENETREFDNYMFICRDFASRRAEIVLGDNTCRFRNENGSGIRFVDVEYDGTEYLEEGAASLQLRHTGNCIHTVLDEASWKGAAARRDFRGPGWLRYHIRNRHSGERFYSSLLHFNLIVHLGIACKIRTGGDGHWYLVPVWCLDEDKVALVREFTATYPYPTESRKENWPLLTNALFWNPQHDTKCCKRDFEEMQLCFNGHGAKELYGKYAFDVTAWCAAGQDRTFGQGSAVDGAFYGAAHHFSGTAGEICRQGQAFFLLNFLNPAILWPAMSNPFEMGKQGPYYLYLHNYTYL